MADVEQLAEWYYGRWPQYAAMGAAMTVLVLVRGQGRPGIQVAGVGLLFAAALGPAAIHVASMFVGDSEKDPQA